MKTKILISLVALGLIFSSVNMASAVCSVLGKVVYIHVIPLTPTTQNAYIFVNVPAATVMPAYFYFFQTGNPSVISAALASESGNLGVRIEGDAAACPAAGAYRDGGIIQRIYTFTNIY